MAARLMEANPLVEETRQQVAVKRGPIVFCLESPDLPAGVRMQDVVISSDSKLATHYEANMLDGVTVVDASALAKPQGDWEGELYRPLRSGNERKINLRLIPYFAWSNRGASEMSVWLPVK
jgi:DUF1680 family protein